MKTILVIAAAALAATGAAAQMAPAGKTAPAAKPAAKAGSAKMATATTKSGKKITYDCSKKGNMNKKACKG